MALIDRLIKTIYKYNADELVLASGQKVTLTIGSSRRSVSAEAATRQQIEVLLREILPGDLATVLGEEGSHEFPYTSPSGSVKVQVERTNGFLRIRAIPIVSEDAAAPSPALSSVTASDSPGPSPVTAEPARPETPAEPAPQSIRAETAAIPPAAQDAGIAPQAAPVMEAPPAPAVATAPAAGPAPATAADVAPGAARAAQAMEELFMKMVQEGCSDLHICTGNPPLFRKDGEFLSLGEEAPLTEEQVRDLVFSITPRIKREEFETRHDTDFAHEIPSVARYRCNLFRDRMGVGGVFRLIPSKIPTAEELGLSRQILQLCELSKGLVLVTGPTGSGKSTTLAALLDYINRNRTAHVITIEDPIEFVHLNQKCLINQREVGTHTEGFKVALRAALREDPDCILVGEMTDLETIAIAIETAETGHLVFGTLHTSTVASTVDRIIDQFPADRQSQVRTMLSESLKGVLSQTLCRKKGGGRVAALEVLLVNAAASNLIREGKAFQIPSIMQTGKGQGMSTLNDALLELVQKGVVSPKEAYFKSVAKTEFKTLLERNSFKVDAA